MSWRCPQPDNASKEAVLILKKMVGAYERNGMVASLTSRRRRMMHWLKPSSVVFVIRDYGNKLLYES